MPANTPLPTRRTRAGFAAVVRHVATPAALAPLLRRGSALAAAAALAAVPACASTPTAKSTDQIQSGVTAANLGYWQEAEFRWLKALAIDPGNAAALNGLAVRFERLGEFAKAKDHYERARAATPEAASPYIDWNWRQFGRVWERIGSEESGEQPEAGSGADDEPAEAADTGPAPPEEPPPGLGLLEILIAVPDQGPNLAGYNRILIGNFSPTEDSEADINEFAVRYFRRRITQRTFFQTQDQAEQPLPPERRGDGLLADPQFWVARAAEVGADLVLTGYVGMTTSEESRMVRERIRSPDGQIREVARFQDSLVYKVQLDYVVLRGEDGETLLDGSLSAEQSFPAEESIQESEAVIEVFEELLPQVLDAITPRRSEQSRYLIY